MKGIILAGGHGTRLYPITKAVSKQLLPVYDKPMIYYPISVLIKAGIRDILIISTPNDIEGFKRLLGKGLSLGLKFSYKVQKYPDGIASAFILGKEFIGKDPVCLILGDNIFHGEGLEILVKKARSRTEIEKKASVFAYRVNDPSRYGVVEFDKSENAISIEEKPINPKSNYAVTGLYFYPNNVLDLVTKLKPSERGELEITSLNEKYLESKELVVSLMGRGYALLDTGTHKSLANATEFIKVLENRQGLKIGCIEEVAMSQGFITPSHAIKLGEQLSSTNYGKYIIDRAKETIKT